VPIVIDPPEAPPVSPPVDDGSFLWELVYNAMGYLRDLDAENGYQLRGAIEDLCAPYQDVYDLVRDRDDQPAPYALFFDPQGIPAKWLPYQSQYVGVIPQPQMTEEQLRLENEEPTGWKRGQPRSLELVTKRGLTGSQWVRIRARSPEVGHTYIRTLLSETPDPARKAKELREEVPAWEILDYEAIEGVSVADVAAGWDTVADVTAAFPTVFAVATMLPDELPE
jgi:hypothetical protein